MIRRVHRVAGTLSLVAFFTFTISLIWEKWGGEIPCAFCRMERTVFLVGALTTALSFFSREPIAQRVLLTSAFIWAAGMVISFQHAGVQHHWFPLPPFCEAPEPQGTSVEEIAQQLLNTPVVRCDRVTMSFLGQPPATYLCFLMLGMMVTCFFGAAQPTLQEEIESQSQHAEEHREWELESIRQKEVQIREWQEKRAALEKKMPPK